MTPPSSKPELESILRRLERLEAESRESRFWGRWGPLIYLVIGAAIPLGLGVDSITRSLSLAQPLSSPRVEAQEFLLRDADGQVRAKLMMGDKSPRLTFYDAEGNPTQSLSVERVSASKTKSTKEVPRFERTPASAADARSSPAAPAPSQSLQTLPAVPATPAAGGAQLVAVQSNRSTAGALAAPLTKPRPPAAPVRHTAASGTSQLPASPVAPSGAPGGLGQGPAEAPALPAAPGPSSLPAAPATAPAIPAPKLRVVGYVEKPGVGREVVVSDGFGVYVTHQGETFAERFKVLKITPTVVSLFDTYTSQNFDLGFSP